MQDITGIATYNRITSGYYKTDERILVGSGATYETYNKADIISSYVDRILFDDFSIGNAISGQAEVVLAGSQNIPVGNRLIFQQRVRNESETSEWFNRGVYFIYSVKIDDNGAKTTITAYDDLYRTDYPFLKSGTWQEQTALDIVEAIVTDLSADLDVRLDQATETLLYENPKTIPYIPVVGESGTTARQMLSYIAVMYGGNWVIDEDGLLKLVFANYSTADTSIQDDFEEVKFIQKYAGVDRVRIWTSTNTYLTSPSDAEEFAELDGYILEAYCPYVNQTLVDDLLDTFEGVEYQPYEAKNAFLTPIAQLGDGITIAGKQSVIGQLKTVFSNTSPSDIGANGVEDEVTYNFQSPEERLVAQASAQLTAQLSVIDGQIRTDVNNAIDGLSTSLTESMDAFDGRVTNLETNTETYFRFTEEGLEIGRVNEGQVSFAKVQLNSNGLIFISPDNTVGAKIEMGDDGKYRLLVYGGRIVNYLELGPHWFVVAGDDSRLTFKARG